MLNKQRDNLQDTINNLNSVLVRQLKSHCQKMKNSFEFLEALTTIVADTADFEAMKKYRVTDATTNPSIILQAATLPRYEYLLNKAVERGNKTGKTLDDKIENAFDMVLVFFGKEILNVIPGRVHIQVDARLSFDTEKYVMRALKIVRLFAEEGISKERIMIKIPATWEGIQAARDLEQKHGVHCNLTTMFSLVQAVACAEAGASILSPFVGRIRTWYEKNTGRHLSINKHPGVNILKDIHNYFRTFGYQTKILGAYFINVEEVKAVAGCDLVTVPLELLDELAASSDVVPVRISKESMSQTPMKKIDVSESKFRWLLNEDQMTTELLSEVIRKFAADCVVLENTIKKMLMSIK